MSSKVRALGALCSALVFSAACSNSDGASKTGGSFDAASGAGAGGAQPAGSAGSVPGGTGAQGGDGLAGGPVSGAAGGAGAAQGGTGTMAEGGSAQVSGAGSGGTSMMAGLGGTIAGSAGSGASGAASGSAGTGPSDGPFVLAWQDDFDTLDASAWQLQTFTWDGNQAQFSTQNASVSNGVLTISLTAAPSGADKPYLGVEMRSAKTLTYGKVSTRMRFATGPGVVSGLVLFYTPYPNCDWNEIDIEHLGKSSTTSQLNAQVFLGTPVANCTSSVSPTQDPAVVDLGFNAETDFHLYDIEWTPDGVKYFGDGVLLRTWTANIAHLKLPETILLTIWASSSADWAGALSANSAPTSADVDWIKVYDYKP